MPQAQPPTASAAARSHERQQTSPTAQLQKVRFWKMLAAVQRKNGRHQTVDQYLNHAASFSTTRKQAHLNKTRCYCQYREYITDALFCLAQADEP